MPTQNVLPTGNGTTAAMTAVGAATVWEAVDDPVGTPDDGTYGELVLANDDHLFTYTAPAIPAFSTINSVTVTARNEAIGSNWTFSALLRVGGTNYASSTTSVTTSVGFVETSKVWATNPATTVTWTLDEVNGDALSFELQEFGVRVSSNTTAGDKAQTSQIYLVINYTAGGSSKRHTLTLLGVG